MSMNLKTHTAYPEIQLDEQFDWTLEDEGGRVAYPNVPHPGKDRPNLAPEGAEFTPVFLWGAKIIGQPAESFEDFTGNGGEPEDFVAPVPATFEGEADSRRAAIDDAKAAIEAVADDYLIPAEETE